MRPLAILDSRIVVPAYVEPLSREEMQKFEDGAGDDAASCAKSSSRTFSLTGDANLLIEPEEKRDPKADLVTRVASVCRAHRLDHFPDLHRRRCFRTHIPTRARSSLARQQLSVTYIPPDEIPKSPRPPPGPESAHHAENIEPGGAAAG